MRLESSLIEKDFNAKASMYDAFFFFYYNFIQILNFICLVTIYLVEFLA